MLSNEIVAQFLRFFQDRGHEFVPSDSICPNNDPSLLFTNAGMVPFKNVFLGLETRTYSKAVSIQKCLRAGGKHNDLENVGYTARHHTFFEMLGNFSFGDYFKREAIHYAWEFLTQVLKIPSSKLWITVYQNDAEAADIWLKEIKVDPKKFSYLGDADNFWSMGDTGPCGPSSEIFYDHGPSVPGGPPGSSTAEGDRFVEIWNLVFMQYNRADNGELSSLPKPAVDTGMGLERISAVMQGVSSNYDTQEFQTLIQQIAKVLNLSKPSSNLQSVQVIADHLRASVFLINDGVTPLNEGRGYVLRRILRRAIRHGHLLGAKQAFMYQLVDQFVQAQAQNYPELQSKKLMIENVIHKEELQFAKTLNQGLKILADTGTQFLQQTLPGELIFKLYDTYGFPVDLLKDYAKEHDLKLDLDGYNKLMAGQKNRARQASQFSSPGVAYTSQLQSDFVGYTDNESSTTITDIIFEKKSVSSLKVGQKAWIILASSPFYAESGGQAGDSGTISHQDFLFRVSDTQKMHQAIAHYGLVETGSINLNAKVTASIDLPNRLASAANHSATHLLHAALKQILDVNLEQKGSSVDAARLRFDFNFERGVSDLEIRQIEDIINQKILENTLTQIAEMDYQEAIQLGACGLFGDKYQDKVRVLNIAQGFSLELCGGIHVTQTGNIGLFKIISETGVAAGVRRIEALTGAMAIKYINQQEDYLNLVCRTLKTVPAQAETKLSTLLVKQKDLEKKLLSLEAAALAQFDPSPFTIKVKQHTIIVCADSHLEPNAIKELQQNLLNKTSAILIAIGQITSTRVHVSVAVANSWQEKFSAVSIIKDLATRFGGKGGGRVDQAQAGGTDAKAYLVAMAELPENLSKML